jgi:putative hemolysin
MSGDPFQIVSPPDGACLRRLSLAAARPFLSWLWRLREYSTLYEQVNAGLSGPFDGRVLNSLEIQPRVSGAGTELIPIHGPLLVASNHPHGVLDGLILSSIIRRTRSDIRILTNHLLSRIPELAELCFFVDPFGGPKAASRSRAGLRAAHHWLKNGGTLVVFPAGEVAHRSAASGSRADSPWRATTGRLALATGARVVPAFIAGGNTKWFYAAGRLHPVLRTALLPREFLNQRRQVVSVRLGAPLAARELAATPKDAMTATQSIRRAVEQLGNAASDSGSDDHSAVLLEISRLPRDSCLIESGAFQVFLAEAGEIPATLREIGRLREVTYRAVGEGTGRDLDLDDFDDRYLHLFCWDRERRCLIGAYRIGRTDRIMATHGLAGLYTGTLFRYDERLISRLSPALELGRSFVRVEYQKTHNALSLLWKGIGQFVAQQSQYRVLFGAVSISRRYSDLSHRLLMTFLQENHRDRDLADLVDAVNPPRLNPAPAAVRSVEEVNKLVARTEVDGKGIPILLRQYLKLNAKLLGFNVDSQFGDTLDALMMVDLTTVDSAILNRYLGRQQAAQFLVRHRGVMPAHAA